MKRIAVILAVLFFAIFSLLQGDKKDKKNKTSHIDPVDKGMTGPKGERIFIGSGGGRYYTKDDKSAIRDK